MLVFPFLLFIYMTILCVSPANEFLSFFKQIFCLYKHRLQLKKLQYNDIKHMFIEKNNNIK